MPLASITLIRSRRAVPQVGVSPSTSHLHRVRILGTNFLQVLGINTGRPTCSQEVRHWLAGELPPSDASIAVTIGSRLLSMAAGKRHRKREEHTQK
jgi:hypothetical protein